MLIPEPTAADQMKPSMEISSFSQQIERVLVFKGRLIKAQANTLVGVKLSGRKTDGT